VTATLKVVLADRFWAGVNVTDNPSLDNARLPLALVAPWDTLMVPGISAVD
jgi:hypothetical protein